MEFVNREWFYDFRKLPQKFSETSSEQAIGRLQPRYASVTKSWDNSKNTEWLGRHYIAAKLIMLATLNINALEYAESKNLRVVTHYLKYYALFSLFRSLVLTIPEQKWGTADENKITHSKAINVCSDYIALFDKTYAKEVKNIALTLKSSRELISYHAPSSGDKNIPNSEDFIDICTSIGELAQLNSELLEQSLNKHAFTEKFSLDDEVLAPLVDMVIEGRSFFDNEDAYRLGYFARKQPMPMNIMFMMREGHVEDFFGAWCGEEELDDNFNPDENWRVIFDIP